MFLFPRKCSVFHHLPPFSLLSFSLSLSLNIVPNYTVLMALISYEFQCICNEALCSQCVTAHPPPLRPNNSHCLAITDETVSLYNDSCHWQVEHIVSLLCYRVNTKLPLKFEYETRTSRIEIRALSYAPFARETHEVWFSNR
jgi:hypothetical protein